MCVCVCVDADDGAEKCKTAEKAGVFGPNLDLIITVKSFLSYSEKNTIF